MANSLLTLAQITRDVVQFFRNSNAFLGGEYPAPVVLSDAAHRRSMELLESWLSEEQLESFRKRQYFEVIGSASGVRYQVHPEYYYGIVPLGGSYFGSRLCVVPHGARALGDIMLAQKIGLETAERATLKLANKAERMWA